MTRAAELRPFSTRLDAALFRAIKLHAAHSGKPVQELVDEALRQLLHGTSSVGRRTPRSSP